MLGKNRAEKAESIAVVVSFALCLLATIGLSAYTEPIRGNFILVGFSGGIVFCMALLHQRMRVKKEKRTQDNTAMLRN